MPKTFCLRSWLLVKYRTPHIAAVVQRGHGRLSCGAPVHPFQDFINLQRLVGRVEINPIPLQYNIFTYCKSELKYFEAAAVRTVSIVSPTLTYARAIRDGDNGYLARAHELLDKLTQVLSHFDEYQTIVERAVVHAQANYNWQTQRNAILDDLGIA